MKRVVVTGLGLVTPIGVGLPVVWERAISGKSGIRALIGPEYAKLPCRVAATVPTDQDKGGINLTEKFSEAERRSCSRGILFSLLATEEALKNSKLLSDSPSSSLSQEAKERIGVAVGMGMLDLQDVLDTGKTLQDKGYSRVSPYFIPRILPNLSAGQISIKYGFQGPNHCVSTACATGAHAIGDAFNFIRLNHADVMIAGGSESSINPLTIATFARLRALSTKYNDTPETASRPFDAGRDGFVMGEGAGILVLESLEHAQSRGAPILCEILGYGLSGDGHHMTAAREDGHGAYRAMKNALDSAGIRPEQVSYINCHATSTPIGDKAEITAMRKLFQSKNINDVAISSTKGSLGHLLGAAGAVESAISILALHHGQVPPATNISQLDKEFDGINIVTSSKKTMLDVSSRLIALKNSFGFGGTNACICLASFNDK